MKWKIFQIFETTNQNPIVHPNHQAHLPVKNHHEFTMFHLYMGEVFPSMAFIRTGHDQENAGVLISMGNWDLPISCRSEKSGDFWPTKGGCDKPKTLKW
jgi:hypothetical protein